MTVRDGIIVIDHGSRQPAANQLVVQVAARVQARRPGGIVTYAHMEMAPPSLEEALRACLDRGAERILVLPYFLGPGRHTRETIPELVAALCEKHPGLEVQVAGPLGEHEKLIDVLLERAGQI
ncbi:MAG: cobalamin biosynthesis protein CbiX [Myxococcota bacterium]|nr:cobalamin biosynthesis protein CbiX [Myxococcota bacterium]